MTRRRISEEPYVCSIPILPVIEAKWRASDDPRCARLLARMEDGKRERGLNVIPANASDITLILSLVLTMEDEGDRDEVRRLLWQIRIGERMVEAGPGNDPWAPTPWEGPWVKHNEGDA